MPEFDLKVEKLEGTSVAVVKPQGSIDSRTTPTLEACLGQLISQGVREIVVDLSKTSFISSSGFGVFFSCISTLREKGGDLVLMDIPKPIKDVLEILNIEEYFRTIDSLDEYETTRK